MKFIHFGCWNNTNDGKLEDVMDKLKIHLQEEKNDFIIIAGDNYYPKKIKEGKEGKTKIIYPTKLKNGFDLLPKGIEINMILGNHDLETNLNGDAIKIREEGKEEVEKDCFILTEELEKTKNSNIKYVVWSSKIVEHTLILMIDTSIYTGDAKDYLSCYQKMPCLNTANTVDNIRTQQNEFIKTSIEINPHIQNIIFVGHHPIVYVKNKKDKEKDKKDKEKDKEKEKDKDKDKEKKSITTSDIYSNFIKVLKSVCTEVNKNYYYLCADLHLYQQGTIKIGDIKIEQYIVGTGGTKLDDEVIVEENSLFEFIEDNNNTCEYTINKCEKIHGFLECNISEPNIPKFKFIRMPETVFNFSKVSKGGYKKRKTMKKRKLKQKKTTQKRKRKLQR